MIGTRAISRPRRAALAAALSAALLLAACGGGGDSGSDRTGADAAGSDGTGFDAGYQYPPAPDPPTAGLDSATATAAAGAIEAAERGSLAQDAIADLVAGGDPRLGWLISDLMRFAPGPEAQLELARAFGDLTGVEPTEDPAFARSPWLSVTNHMIAWDLPAPPGYRRLKGRLFTSLEPGWAPFFSDREAEIDYRLLSWGGVLIDDRPLGDRAPCPEGCIPALDDPELTNAARGEWYPDGRIVFGVEVGGEAVAFPRNIMEVHEMVNITIGGRRLAIPYCTLCGSAQAYFTDRDAVNGGDLVLRTSGLLSRSNKVMYELASGSVFDTFTGVALSGPLRDRGVELGQASVVTTTWVEWRERHPETRIVASDGGLGREYPLDPLGGRDDDGPIFPVGDVDPRLPVQEQVVGVINAAGAPVAFPAAAARRELLAGRRPEAAGVVLAVDAGGVVAEAADGGDLASHQAFWFAWSQFHPDTELWSPSDE
jgi:hypothetical protein